MSNGARLQIVRHLAASPERVWQACTQPGFLRQWFSPQPFCDCVVEADVRIGGRFYFRMTGEPGTFAAEGIYRQVAEQRRLVLTWKWVEGPADQPPDGVTSLVTFDLEAERGGTRLTLTHEGLGDQASAESHEEGWIETLGKLARLLEGPAGEGK